MQNLFVFNDLLRLREIVFLIVLINCRNIQLQEVLILLIIFTFLRIDAHSIRVVFKICFSPFQILSLFTYRITNIWQLLKNKLIKFKKEDH